jgi:hypothetical protein
MRLAALFGASMVLLVACGGGSENSDEGPFTPASKDTGSSTDDSGNTTVTDSGGTSTDDTGGSGTDSGSTTIDDGPGIPSDGAPAEELRFAIMGDTGEGNADQKKVGDAIAAKCAKDGCEFVQLLGDNFYDVGVSSTTDPQWTTKFLTPYGAVSLPFYAVLGNHDYGASGSGADWDRAQNEVEYTKVSTKWKMPDRHWQRTDKGVAMFALDTNAIMFRSLWGSRVSAQQTAINGWVGSSTAKWKIAFGHHPYLSNGPHGNAGNYEGMSWIPIANGKTVKEFLDDSICGKVDVYFAGHDHSRQWHKNTCKGTELIVTGAGAKTTELKGSNPVYWEDNLVGFTYVVIKGNTFTAEMVSADGVVQYTRTITK